MVAATRRRGDEADVVSVSGVGQPLVPPDDAGIPAEEKKEEAAGDSPDGSRKKVARGRSLHARILEFLGECAPHDAAIACPCRVTSPSADRKARPEPEG